MTTLETIKAHLAGFIAPLAVATPGPGSSLMASKENGMALYAALKPVFVNVSPLHAEQDASFPEALYRLAGVGATEWAGIEVSHVSSFDVSARCTTYKDLVSRVDALDVALQALTGFDVVDYADAYDDLRKVYRADLAVEVCRPLGDVILIELSQSMTGEGFMGKGCNLRQYQLSYAVVHHAGSPDALSDLRDDTAIHLNNFKPDSDNQLVLQTGEILPAAGGLFGWVDIYTLEITQ